MAAWQTPQRRRQQNNNKQPVGTQGGLQGEWGRREVNCYSLAVSLETIKQPYGWLTQCGVPTTRLYSSVRHASVCHSVEHNAWLPSKDPNIRTGGDCWQQRLWNSVWNHQTTHHHQNIIKSLLTSNTISNMFYLFLVPILTRHKGIFCPKGSGPLWLSEQKQFLKKELIWISLWSEDQARLTIDEIFLHEIVEIFVS